jgi:hypothetical protein
VVLCPNAREQGKPYTARLLPDFLIPQCVIRLDHLVEAARESTGERTTERVCENLGCIDPRTARKHLERLESASGQLSLELAEGASSTPELGRIPDADPAATAFMRFESLIERKRSAVMRSADIESDIGPLRLLQAALRNRSEKKPSTCASARVRPP